MFQAIDNYILRNVSLTPAELDFFHSKFELKTYPKKTILLRQGQICNFEGFILSGCTRKYYIDENGFEVVLQFGIENWWVSDIASFAEQKPARVFIETIEETTLLQISHDNKNALFEQLPQLDRMFLLLLQKSYAVLEDRFFATVAKSAEARYLDFIERYPSVVQRVPQHQIASYLGISPEFLSKIRKGLSKKKTKANE